MSLYFGQDFRTLPKLALPERYRLDPGRMIGFQALLPRLAEFDSGRIIESLERREVQEGSAVMCDCGPPAPFVVDSSPPTPFVARHDRRRSRSSSCRPNQITRQSGKRENLPKEDTARMTKWAKEHMDCPYPTDAEKQEFVNQSRGRLTTEQVANWFINFRRRKLKQWKADAAAEEAARSQEMHRQEAGTSEQVTDLAIPESEHGQKLALRPSSRSSRL